MNVSLEDCIALCGLDRSEVEAIAEHEHTSEIVAAAPAQYLLHEPGGATKIRDIIVDDLRIALRRHDKAHAAEFLAALRHFLTEYWDVLATEPAVKHV